MAFVQDISLLMRELLKVPKDYTPTALEISKYIKSRYSNDNDTGRRPIGSRAFSSGPHTSSTKTVESPPFNINAPRPKIPQRMTAKKRPSGRSLSYSSIRAHAVKQPSSKKNNSSVETAVKMTSQNRTYHQKRAPGRKHSKKPMTAPTQVEVYKTPHEHRSFWSWQTAKNHIRQAVSEIVTAPVAKTKLSALAEQHRLDPNMEVGLERQRKEMLKHMVDPGANRAEPVRTREVIQKLLEDNKLEAQRREIAKLTELARSKVLEARKATYTRNAKKREMNYAS